MAVQGSGFGEAIAVLVAKNNVRIQGLSAWRQHEVFGVHDLDTE